MMPSQGPPGGSANCAPDRSASGAARGGHSDPRHGIDLWLLATDSAPDCGADDLLTAEEHAACAAFQVDADRRRARAARALVRTTLSRYRPVPPDAWRFASGAHGRPEIAAPTGTGLHFNLAHTRELIACAVTAGAAPGVDLERTASHRDLPAVARAVLTGTELRALAALPPVLQTARFLGTWTLKESYLKARGLGLTLSPQAVGFDLDTPGRIHAEFAPEAADDPHGWWFALLRVAPAHLLALAARLPMSRADLRVHRVAAADGPAVPIEPTWIAATAATTRHPC